MIEVVGKNGIVVRILADTVSQTGKRLVTYELQYQRIIHSELMTHRVFSRNAASSRAIPFTKMQTQLTAVPVRFGGANAGMQDKGEHTELINGYTAQEWWNLAKLSAKNFAQGFYDAGYAKQIYNRPTECFQMMKTVLSSTETSNFFWLRNDEAADPTLQELAHCMQAAYNQSTPTLLKTGEYHLPYVDSIRNKDGTQQFYIRAEEPESENSIGLATPLTIDEAIKVSCARCAAVSYRNENYGLEKSLELYDRLVGSDRKHASALEHCATPMATMKMNIGTHMTRKDYINVPSEPSSWEAGVTHMDKSKNLWSGNFNGFVQYRKLVPGENYTA